jgi:hypothetical protein
MRRETSAALTTLLAVCAGLSLASCTPTYPDTLPDQGPVAVAAPAPPPPQAEPVAAPPATQTLSREEAVPPFYPRYGDSDDYLCNNGASNDPRTVQACARLRGPNVPPVPHPPGRWGDSDDYLCNFAPPGDPRTIPACARLRGPSQ